MPSRQVRGLDTQYNGYNFRSRVEARWALFFDNAGIPYEYEPQLFDLGAEGYLPDFFLDIKASRVINRYGRRANTWRDRGMWAEVKHTVPEDEDIAKLEDLCSGTGYPATLLVGDPRVGPYRVVFPSGWAHLDFSWCMCPQCRDVGLVYPWVSSGKEYIQLRCCNHQESPVGKKLRHMNAVKAIEFAVDKSRFARFGVWE